MLNGLIFLDKGGVPLYSKVLGMNINVDTVLLGGFLSAIQNFAQELSDTGESYIKEMRIQNFSILYRQLDIGTFIGIVVKESDIKSAQTVLEYLILMFLTKFRHLLQSNAPVDIVILKNFDDIFLECCTAKEKVLKKLVQKECETSHLLQGVLNHLVNYFPINELIKLNKEKLTTIGKKLIWVELSIEQEETERIMEKLKNKTSKIYGAKTFDSILEEVKCKLIS